MVFIYIAGATLAGFCAIFALMPLFLFFGVTVRRSRDTKRIALTFDDGPHPQSTPALLAALAEAKVNATFFCPAERLLAHPELGEAIVAGGHELANHSYAHRWSLALWSEKRARKDLSEAQLVLRRFGNATRFFRPVAGICSPPLLRAAHRLGLVTVTWSARAFDGARTVSAKTTLKRLRRGLASGGIVMLHDRPSGSAAEVVGLLLAEARARGLSLHRLSDVAIG